MAFDIRLNHYSFSVLLTFILGSILCLFLLIKERERKVPRMFAYYTLTITFWALGWFLMAISANEKTGLFWGKLLHIPASLIPSTFLHFVQCLTEIDHNLSQKIIRKISYFFSVVFMFLNYSAAFISSTFIQLNGLTYITIGSWYVLFAIYFLVVVTLCLSLILLSIFRGPKVKRTQLIYVFAAYAFGYMGGTAVFCSTFRLNPPWFSYYPIPIAHLALFYLIIRHRLLDVRIVIRRAALLIGIYAVLLIGLFPIIMMVRHKFLGADQSLKPYFLSEAFIVGAVLSIGPFLYAYFVRRGAYFHEQTLAGITHELKSPLAAIESVLDILQDNRDLSKLPKEQMTTYIEMIQRNSSRLRFYVNDLLQAFSTKELAGNLKLKMVDITAIADSLVEQYEGQAKAQNVKLKIHTEGQLITECDPEKIKLVISNLLNNALKFTSDGTIIISMFRSDKAYRIEVSDTGVGIPKDELPYIFDRFYQGRLGHKKKGSGLGLAIAKLWVKAHGGEIWAESEGEGKGSRIVLTISA